MGRLFLYLLWIAATLLPLSGGASTFVTHQVGYLKGAPLEISLQQLSQQEFSPIGNRFALGYSDSPVWMRVDVKRDNYHESLNFSLWPPRFQNITVYLQTDHGFTKLTPSDDYKISTDNLFNLFHTNIYKLYASDKDQVLFFRLQSKSSIIGNIDIYLDQTVNNQNANQGFLLGSIFFGLMPFILVFLILGAYTKQTVYSFYCISLVFTAILYLGTAGFDFEDFIPYFSVSLEDQVAFLTLINPLTSTLFMSYVADVLHAPIRLTSNLRKYVLVLLLLAPMYFWVDSTIWAKSYMLNNFLLSAVMVYALIRYFDRKSKVEWAIVFIFVLMNLMGPRVYASFLGWVQINTSIFIVQSMRIVVVPIVLILMLALIESKNRARLVDLEIKRQVAEENRSIENERRRTYERFITMIVHEIKTPLSIIQIAAASLQRHLANNMPELNRINHIQESVTEINQVFNKCIQMVDVENGSVAVQPSDFGLSALIDDLKRSLKSDRIRYTVQAAQKINTDYVILKTILVNLLSNAIKYAKPDSTILLTIEPQTTQEGKRQLMLKVCNEVGPIGPPDPNLAFKRYYRAEAAKVLGGTGLGLWLSQELASSIRAHIQLSCTESETCFLVFVDMN